MKKASIRNNIFLIEAFLYIIKITIDSIVTIDFIMIKETKYGGVIMIREFFKYAVPSALAMFVSSLYTIIDGIFVSRLPFVKCPRFFAVMPKSKVSSKF